MKQVYENILLHEGSHIAGICKLQIAPREWLSSNIIIDFNTGKIKTAINFITGRNWLDIELTLPSFEFDEKPKSNKSGQYIELAVAGTINNFTASVQQVIETLRYSEFVVLLTDANNNMRLIGDAESGMVLSPDHSVKNAVNEERLQLSFIMESETTAPIYEV